MVDERDCIRKARSGDRDAFCRLVEAHQARLRAVAARYVASADDVFDLVQDTFFNAYRQLSTFDPEREFWPWLRAICHNHVRNFFRSRKVRKAVSLVDDAIRARIGESGPDERVGAMKRCIDRLPPEHRELVGLRYHDGVAVNEIARKLHKTPTAVSMMLGRLRKALTDCVAQT